MAIKMASFDTQESLFNQNHHYSDFKKISNILNKNEK
jgi:hypothetical protein